MAPPPVCVTLDPTEKANAISIVAAYPYKNNPNEATWMTDNMNTYCDIITAIGRQLTSFDENYPYLREFIACFNDADLISVGIYNNHTEVSTLTNPNILINSTCPSVSITQNSNGLALLGGSAINGTITISSNISLNYLYIGSGCTVDLFDSSAFGTTSPPVSLPTSAYVGVTTIRFLNGVGGALNGVIQGSQYSAVNVDEGAYFGGIVTDNPESVCSDPVTDLTYGYITRDTIPLTWVSPSSGIIAINVYYKKSSSNTWIIADSTVGTFMGMNGFSFTQLSMDTFYDFQVITICTNGGFPAPVQLLEVNTVCCGVGSPPTSPIT